MKENDGSTLKWSDLAGAVRVDAPLTESDLRAADIWEGVTVKAHEAQEALRLHKLWLSQSPEGKQAIFVKADLSESDLSKADLRGANLSEADLREADLSKADLRGANLSEADLSEADLSGANLIGADLRKADLIGVDLRKADLSKADLRGANLKWADLIGADLSGALFCKANIHGAIIGGGTLQGIGDRLAYLTKDEFELIEKLRTEQRVREGAGDS